MELLAPAGSMETLMAAVQSGADAVYIGGTEFSARSSAANFSISEIENAVKYCHLRGVKLHVAANILVKEKEVERFLDYTAQLNRIGVDAIIIQDIGMAKIIHQSFPDLPLHASTQMTISNVSGVKKLKEFGFSRVVLARELSNTAIKKICNEVDIEIEVFCHGAICMCYSGQCYFSSMIGGRSGNRGRCAQPCRLPFQLDGNTKYFLSPKDMSLVNELKQLEQIGVTSLKIEGRLKRKEYVSAVCGIYRKYLDCFEQIKKEDYKELLDAFNRSGFTNGYFTDRLGKNMMSLDNPSNISENVFTDEAKSRCKKNINIKKLPINIYASLKKNEPIQVTLFDDNGNCVTSTGTIKSEIAKNVPLSKERAEKQLTKLGDTSFYVNNTEIEIDDGIIIPIAQINEARRDAIKKFEEILTKQPSRRAVKLERTLLKNTKQTPYLTVEVSNYEQAEVAIKLGIKRIFAPVSLANKLADEFTDVEIVAKLTPVIRDDRKYETVKTSSIMISNLSQIDSTKKCYGDYRLNITNSESVDFYNSLEVLTMSPELSIYELSKISCGNEVIAYGRIGLMTMENCPLSANNKCQNKSMLHSFTDRKNEIFPLKCWDGCILELLNSKPIYMTDKMVDLLKLNLKSLRLVFTVENKKETEMIINEYKKAIRAEQACSLKENTFTRGHFYNNVE